LDETTIDREMPGSGVPHSPLALQIDDLKYRRTQFDSVEKLDVIVFPIKLFRPMAQ
jgi:hypothetical protein